jgi:hypothetical protein
MTISKRELSNLTFDLLESNVKLEDTISALVAKEVDLVSIRTSLLANAENFTATQINKAVKEFKGATVSRVSNTEEFHNWLVEAPRTEAETKAFILDQGIRFDSINIIAHLNIALSLWSLTSRVRTGEKYPVTLTGCTRTQAEEYIAEQKYIRVEEEKLEVIRLAELEAKEAKEKDSKATKATKAKDSKAKK